MIAYGVELEVTETRNFPCVGFIFLERSDGLLIDT